jgi:hypothetical protein
MEEHCTRQWSEIQKGVMRDGNLAQGTLKGEKPWKRNSYLTQNTLHHYYRDQLVTAV